MFTSFDHTALVTKIALPTIRCLCFARAEESVTGKCRARCQSSVQIEYEALFCLFFMEMQAASHPQLKKQRWECAHADFLSTALLALHTLEREICTPRSKSARVQLQSLCHGHGRWLYGGRPLVPRATIVDTTLIGRLVWWSIDVPQIESTFIKTREFIRAINNIIFMCKKSTPGTTYSKVIYSNWLETHFSTYTLLIIFLHLLPQ
jgi:hypothetical protein